LHLLVGDPQDPRCRAVRDALESRGYSTRMTPNPVVQPARFSWSLDTDRSGTSLAFDEQTPVPDERIESVLVFNAGWLDPVGWQPNDLAYAQAETQAALLAWLWSLDCPVVNRYPPAVWYRPQAPLLSWRRLLQRAGLPTLETLVTNVEQEARAFGRRLAADGVDGVVYGPLTSEARYLVTSDEDWKGLVALQRVTPVSLSAPHGEPQIVCVVGESVVYDREPSAEISRLEPALRRFAAAAGMAVVELALAPTSSGLRVIAVETYPRLQRFRDVAQGAIVDGIVQLLTEDAGLRDHRSRRALL
jgi:hypothetical protein